MQTLILLSLFLGNMAHSSEGQLVLTVKTKSAYSNQLSRVFQRSNELVCVTELSPLVSIQMKEKTTLTELAKTFLKNVKSKTPPAGCRKIVLVALKGEKPGGQCADTPSSKKLLERIASDCGRN
jgi:hypothetical protein